MLLLNYCSVLFLYFIDAFLHQLLIGNQKCDDDDKYDGGMIACLAHDIKNIRNKFIKVSQLCRSGGGG